MRNLFFSVAVMLLFTFFISSQVNAQDEDPHVYTVTTTQFVFPDGGSIAEWDSLNTLYMENVINKNEYIVSQRALRHMWGHNSEDLVYITEYKSFTDIEKGQARNTELFRETWATSEERQAYNNAVNKYFGNHHSDEIYQEVTNQRK
jgi:hypothetical protein